MTAPPQRQEITREALYSSFNAMIQAAKRAYFNLDCFQAQSLLIPVSDHIAAVTREAIIVEKRHVLAEKKTRLAAITGSVAEDEREIAELEAER